MNKFEISPQPARAPESKPHNVEHIETRLANWQVVYNNHKAGVIDGRTIKGADAAVLELVYQDPEATTTQEAGHALERVSAEQALYADIVRQAAMQKTPLFLVDVHKDIGDRMSKAAAEASKTQRGRMAISFLGGILGAMGALKLADWASAAAIEESLQGKPKRTMSRRNFLRLGAAALGGASVAAIMPAWAKYAFHGQNYNPDGTGTQDNESKITRQIAKTLEEANDAVYGDTYTHDLGAARSTLFAYRSQLVAQSLQQESSSTPEKPTVGIVVGNRHNDIETKLGEDTEQLQKQLQEELAEYNDLWGSDDNQVVRIDFLEVPGEPNQRTIKLSIVDMPVM